MNTLRPVHVDGLIFVMIAFFGAVASALSGDDAAKYIGPATLWYAKNICTAVAAALLALKMYRSTTYSKDVQEQRVANASPSGLTAEDVKQLAATVKTDAGGVTKI